MSFTGNVKNELCQLGFAGAGAGRALAYGMLAFARSFSPDEISLSTESAQVAEKYRQVLRAAAPRSAVIGQAQEKMRGKLLHKVELRGQAARRTLLGRMLRVEDELTSAQAPPEECGALLAGAFLVCGSITDPQKEYRIEFAVREQPLAHTLHELAQQSVPGGRLTRRRANWVVYWRGKEKTADLLTLMGASRASLALIEVEMLKEVRNKAMRLTNCETANIGKTARAAALQIDDIQLVLREKGLLALPEELRETALLRLENPEHSLRDLARLFAQQTSGSAVFRRLDKLGKLAAAIREGS